MVLDLLVPAHCAGCGTRGAPSCPGCSQVWGSLTEVVRAPVAGLAPVYALAAYQGIAKRLLIAYKERGRRDLAPSLGQAIAAALLGFPGSGPPRSPGGPAADPTDRSSATGSVTDPRPWCLVPAPSRRSASRLRGGPHVQLLAESAARCLASAGVEAMVAPALTLKGARDAVGLTRTQRIANLSGRLRFVAAGRPPPGTRVVVLDDVVTTGATAAACLHALTGAGITVSAVLALLAAG
ncbi:ComF family protein [Amycolatopsis sp. FDAARGOS 1241]|uniref:ComF family protein n=1 Tax=Amycolatopsis sp. FDAARGOS 1241 TaxID=2778070 RepID=UPI0019520719|nr:ComF family protein [Amycolatopsis sp. FDAARGOS 1241]QRP47281.1 ComF family protein [Amycolatopsis sp. FDAARGOS 1241]